MKKLFALLLVAVMCFSLAACGGDKETSGNNSKPQTNNSGSQQETAKDDGAANNKTVTIEITNENWQDYFELAPYVDVWEDDFGDIEDIMFGTQLKLREEFVGKLVGIEGAVEISASEYYLCNVVYNAETNEYTIGEAVTEDAIKVNESDRRDLPYSGTFDLSTYGKKTENGVRLMYQTGYQNNKEVEGKVISSDVVEYAIKEIVRIQGTLTISE